MSSAHKSGSRNWSSSYEFFNPFWPMLVFFIGAGSLSIYHVLSLEDQLSEVVNAIDKLDPQVKHAEYEKAKFYAIARDLVREAPKNATAEQIVQESNLRRLQQTQPALMSLDNPAGFTNAAPEAPGAPASSTPLDK